MDEALIFELLIRAVYNVGRHGNRDADANVYREMEHAHRAVELQKEAIKERQVPISTKSVDELEYEARAATARVRNSVERAISHALKNTSIQSATPEIREKLQMLRSKLSIHLYDVKVVDEVISEVWSVFRERGLEA